MQVNREESQTQVGAGARETSEAPYMPRLLENIRNFLLRCSSQMRNGRRNGQNCSLEIHSPRTGDCPQISVAPRISSPSPSQTHTDDAFLRSRTAEDLSDSGVVESPNGTSIIGVRVVDGIPQIIWGEDRRNLPWA
jgi:hypothetical protein